MKSKKCSQENPDSSKRKEVGLLSLSKRKEVRDSTKSPMSIELYIKKYPYPTFENMRLFIERSRFRNKLKGEYTQMSHLCCKIIYENPSNQELIIKMGKKIYAEGGMNLLWTHHVILMAFSPLGDRKLCTDFQNKIIEKHFRNVCSEWNTMINERNIPNIKQAVPRRFRR